MADLGWYTDPGDSGPTVPPALAGNSGTWTDEFTFGPHQFCAIVGYAGGAVIWDWVWTPVGGDAAPTINRPDYVDTGDQGSIFEIIPTPFSFQNGTLEISATLDGVPCSNGPLTLAIHPNEIYASFAWDHGSTGVIVIPPGPAPGIPVGTQKLLEKPDESGYSVTESATALLSCDLDGGSPRTRLDEYGGSRFVTLQWSGRKKRWQTVRDFFKQNIALNCPPFALDLIIETANYQEYLCNVVPGTIKTSSPVGQYYVIQAQLEVPGRDDGLNGWPGGGGGGDGPNQIILFDDEFPGDDYATIDGHIPNIGNGLWIGTGGLLSNKLLISPDFSGADISVSDAVLPPGKTLVIELDVSSAIDSEDPPTFDWSIYFANNSVYVYTDDLSRFRVSDDNLAFDYYVVPDAITQLTVKIILSPTGYSILFNGVGVENGEYLAPNTFADGDNLIGLGAVLNSDVNMTDYIRVRYGDPE